MALRNGGPPPDLSEQALALLAAQPWAGNIRELRNVLEQAVLRCDASRLEAGDIAAVLREQGLSLQPPADLAGLRAGLVPRAVTGEENGEGEGGANPAPRPLAERVATLEREAIAEALRHTGGNKLAAARLLGISRATLYERLQQMPEMQAVSDLRTV